MRGIYADYLIIDVGFIEWPDAGGCENLKHKVIVRSRGQTRKYQRSHEWKEGCFRLVAKFCI